MLLEFTTGKQKTYAYAKNVMVFADEIIAIEVNMSCRVIPMMDNKKKIMVTPEWHSMTDNEFIFNGSSNALAFLQNKTGATGRVKLVKFIEDKHNAMQKLHGLRFSLL